MRLLSRDRNIHTFINTDKKGFITVETAIFLPIFIIGVLTFAYLIKFMSIQEAVFHSFTDEARVLSSEARINPLNVPLFEPMLKSRMYKENGNDISSVEVDHFFYLYPSRGMTGMISMDLNYDVNIKLPIPFYRKLSVSESLMVRGFVGKEEKSDPLSFENMEREEKSDLVWVFPRAGGKYHGEDCIHIKSEPRQMLMSAGIKRNYEPCSICDSWDAPNGSLVYCFRTGKSYHIGSCPIVDKYVISIEKDEAIERGYDPCKKCGGD